MKKLRLNPDLVFREDSDGGLVFDPRTGNVQVLNETAAFICSQLDGTHTMSEIASAVLAEFESPDPDVAREDVAAFVENLLTHSMVSES